MKQIIFVRWGTTFVHDEDCYTYLENYKLDPYRWKKSWRNRIIDGLVWIYESYVPEMPNRRHAKYRAWRIWFEKYFDYLSDEETVLVWSSLWATFLLKYLSEHIFPKKIHQLHLVAPVVVNEWLRGEDLATFDYDLEGVQNIAPQCEEIFIYHSKDDPIVPYHHSKILMEHIPSATFTWFEERGHFYDQPSFLELFENVLRWKPLKIKRWED